MCLICCNCGCCGKEIPPEIKALHSAMRTCKECGAEIPVGESTCPACGWVRPMGQHVDVQAELRKTRARGGHL